MKASDALARYFRRAAGALPYLPRTLRLIQRAAPTWTAVWIVLLLAQGFLPVAIVYLTRPLVNGITAAASSGGDWTRVLWPAALMALALLLTEILSRAAQWVPAVQPHLVQQH